MTLASVITTSVATLLASALQAGRYSGRYRLEQDLRIVNALDETSAARRDLAASVERRVEQLVCVAEGARDWAFVLVGSLLIAAAVVMAVAALGGAAAFATKVALVSVGIGGAGWGWWLVRTGWGHAR